MQPLVLSEPPFVAVSLNTAPRFYRCEPGWRWAPGPLPDFDLWVVMEGEGRMLLDGGIHTLEQGTAFLLPPGARLEAMQDPQRRLLVFAVHLSLRGEGGDDLRPQSRLLPPPGLRLRDLAFFGTLARRAAALQDRADALGRRQCALLVHQMLLLLWEEAFLEPVSPADTRIFAIAAAIRQEPGRDWSVPEVAREACLSPSQLTRRFRAVVGDAPAQYVVRARLERAAQLIRETDMTLGQIAAALGYRDLFFFSRQFKRAMGCPPSALRDRSMEGTRSGRDTER